MTKSKGTSRRKRASDQAPPKEGTSSSGSSSRRESSLKEERVCRQLIANRTIISTTGEREKLARLRLKLKEVFVDRDDAIDALLAVLISRAGCVILGPPGTAKSMLVRKIAEECSLTKGGDDANYFEYLLTDHTMPEELFGPTDISKLLSDSPEVTRRTEGRLPHAEIAFLDEVFRGGSHILNTLLTILNERKFHNGREVEDVPLISFIGAANYPPHTEELEALFDRFPVRIWVSSVLNGRTVEQISKNAAHLLSTSYPAVQSDSSSDNENRILTKDLRRLWADLYIRLGKTSARDPRLNEFIQLFQSFQRMVGLSDRAFTQLWLFAGALDVVRGGNPTKSSGEGGSGHIECFKYIAGNIEQVAEVERRVRRARSEFGLQGP
jgi:MoxR-like ATPase